MLEECARRMPDTAFVIVGPAMQSAPAWTGRPNVRLLGPRPYEQIPTYMRHADVGIIPFKPGLLVHAVNPLKLYEYMAAGLPVVATEWEELKQMNSPALLATDADGFCRQLQAAFAMKNDARWLRYATANSWEHRFAQVMAAVEPLLRDSNEAG
jgi:glycosyltransferase involved in cell wall biosynthesis